MIEPRLRRREHVDRVAQVPLAARTALDQPEPPQRNPDRPGRAPATRELQLLGRQIMRLLVTTEGVQRRAPSG